MKKIIYMLLCVTVIVSFTGCGKKKDEVREDLLVFVQDDLPKLETIKAVAVNKYNEMANSEAVIDKDDLVSSLRDEIIPTYETFIDQLSSVETKTDEVKKIKEEYLEAANIQLEAFKDIITALENHDSNVLDEFEAKNKEACTCYDTYKADLVALGSEHNLKIKFDESAVMGTDELNITTQTQGSNDNTVDTSNTTEESTDTQGNSCDTSTDSTENSGNSIFGVDSTQE